MTRSKYIFFVVFAMFCILLHYDTSAQHNSLNRNIKNQTDYLINNDGDTLYGQMKKKLFSTAYLQVSSHKYYLDPTLYKQYCVDNVKFKSVTLSGVVKPVWMEILEQGRINLYQYLIPSNIGPGKEVNNVLWLARKEDGPYLNVNGYLSSETTAINNLNLLFSDQPALKKSFDLSGFGPKIIQGFIRDYNKLAK